MKSEGISTLSIRSYLRALNFLAHFINCFLRVCVCVCLKRYFEKAFLFDFVMILARMYTKCLEMLCFGKVFNFVMIHAGMYTKCLKSF